jgi:mannose-6-phosphate isomerase-like protein (cupin superfamily)
VRNGWMARALAAFAVLTPMGLAQEVGSNAYVDMFFGDWHASAPHVTLGSLEERDILTRGNGLKPTAKGAVLRYVDSFSYGSLAPHAVTAPTRLEGRQEIFYFLSGRGSAVAGGESAELYPNVAILMPANLEFTIRNTGDQPLTMYLVVEPTPEGFRPNPNMLVRDENATPISSTSGHWAHIVKPLFTTADGLGTLERIDRYPRSLDGGPAAPGGPRYRGDLGEHRRYYLGPGWLVAAQTESRSCLPAPTR